MLVNKLFHKKQVYYSHNRDISIKDAYIAQDKSEFNIIYSVQFA